MTSREIAHFKMFSCLRKKKYSFLGSIIKCVRIKFKDNENLVSYKCLFGEHYHVGHTKAKTKKKLQKIKLALKERGKC